jgi:hypothetical protein
MFNNFGFGVILGEFYRTSSIQWDCTDGLHRGIAQMDCTEGLHRWIAQRDCTDGLHRGIAQMDCTEGLHRWIAQRDALLGVGKQNRMWGPEDGIIIIAYF